MFFSQIKEQDITTEEDPRPGGSSLFPLSSHGTNGSVTSGTPTRGLSTWTKLPVVTDATVFSETTTSTSVENRTETELQIKTTLSDISGTSDISETPTLASSEQTTTEIEIVSSHISEHWTSGITFSTPIHTFNALSIERTILDHASTNHASVTNTTATANYPTDCSDVDISVGLNAIHKIYPCNSENKTALVNCMSTDDGLWTVIQRRFDGSVDFYRGWTDYKEGFGDASGEYWLGNDAIHQLTSGSSYKLKVVLKAWDNVTAYAIYDAFQISDETDGYRLTYGVYNGDAGDSLWQHNGQMFSTLDRDNDSKVGRSCATDYTGAWWYGNCYSSNLNGRYFTEETGLSNVGRITWSSFSSGLSLKETTMMIHKM